jgi:uncharacterized iron-regulated membrane protein
MSFTAFLIQIAISLGVVTIYHLWVSRKRQTASAPPVVAAPLPPPPKSSPAVETVAPEMLAVIAAAIAVVLGRPHRVVSVQQETPHSPEVNVWTLEGRVEQFMSHRVR